MADSIISPASQARRDRRRQGWMQPFQNQKDYGTPGLSGTIDPMESMDLSDSAQGWDIGDAAPPIRPSAVRMAAYQAQGGGEEEPMDEGEDEGPPVRFANMTEDDPTAVQQTQYRMAPQQFQYQQPVCTGPNCRQHSGFAGMGQPQIISERVTHINGVPVDQTSGAMATQSSAVVTPPMAATAGDDYFTTLQQTVDPDPQVRLSAFLKLHQSHRQAATSVKDNKEQYSQYAEHLNSANAMLSRAYATMNQMQQKQMSDERGAVIKKNMELSQQMLLRGTYNGAMNEVDEALGNLSKPISMRVGAVMSVMGDKYQQAVIAAAKQSLPPDAVQKPDFDAFSYGLTGIAAGHNIGDAIAKHLSLSHDGNGPKAESIKDLMPDAYDAYQTAFGSPDKHPKSFDAAWRLMGPAITRRIAAYNWTTQHATEIAAGKISDKPDAATEAEASRLGRSVVAELYKTTVRSFSPQPSTQSAPRQSDTPQSMYPQPQQSQSSGTTPGGGVLLGPAGPGTLRLTE